MKAVAPCNTTTFSHMRAKWSSRTSCAWPVEWKWSSCPSYSIYVLIFHLNTFISARNNINKENCNHLYLLVISRQIKVIKIYMIISGLNTGQNEWKIHSTIHISVCLRTRGVVWGCPRNQFWGFFLQRRKIHVYKPFNLFSPFGWSMERHLNTSLKFCVRGRAHSLILSCVIWKEFEVWISWAWRTLLEIPTKLKIIVG